MANIPPTPPPTGQSWDFQPFKDWLYKLWKWILGILVGLTFGNDTATYSAVVMGSSASGDGAATPGAGSIGAGFSGLVYPTSRRRSVNGNCVIVQRGPVTVTSPAGPLYGGPDHFFASAAGAGGAFTQSTGSLTYQGVTYQCITQTVNSAVTSQTSTNYWSGIAQGYEGFQLYDFPGAPVSISFLFQANWTGNVSVSFRFVVSGNNYWWLTSFPCVNGVVQPVTITTPPVPLAVTFPLGGAAGDLWIGALNNGTYVGNTTSAWGGPATGPICATGYTNWGATIGNTISVTNLQVEKGPPTPFEVWPINMEYNECRRYFQVITDQLVGGYQVAGGTLYIDVPISPMRSSVTTTVGAITYSNASAYSVNTVTALKIRFQIVITATGYGYGYGGLITLLSEII
jgi:hypothetical protein